MTVFRGYLLIIKRNIWTILMYIFIFIGVTSMIQKLNTNTPETTGFSNMKLKVAVMNRDGGALSDTLETMLEKKQERVELPDEESVLQEALYYRNVEYVLIIPEGAEERFANGETVTESITVPGSYYGTYVDSQVNTLLNEIRTYQAGGFSLEEACARALMLSEDPGEVTLMDVNGNAGVRENYNYYFGYLPYAFLGAIIMSMSTVIMEFKKREIRRRIQSAPIPFTVQGGATIMTFLGVGLFTWGVCLLYQTVVYGGGIFGGDNWGYYLLNSLACMVVALSLGYLSGMLANSQAALSGINNVFSLGLCFLGGVFVPLQMIGGSVQKVAQFLPTYWYSTINGILGDYGTISGELFSTIRRGLIIQLLFALAVFSVALVIRRMTLRENG